MAHSTCDLCQQEEVPGHRRNFHSSSISLKLPSKSDAITLQRGDDQLFKCPVCDMSTKNYQTMYNHWNRMSAEHRVQVERYIAKSCHGNLPAGNTAEVSQPPPATEVEDTDVEMKALASKSQTLPGLASGIQQVCTSSESLASTSMTFH
jgi:uncharacterized C2H2 Zn-finger protein